MVPALSAALTAKVTCSEVQDLGKQRTGQIEDHPEQGWDWAFVLPRVFLRPGVWQVPAKRHPLL